MGNCGQDRDSVSQALCSYIKKSFDLDNWGTYKYWHSHAENIGHCHSSYRVSFLSVSLETKKTVLTCIFSFNEFLGPPLFNLNSCRGPWGLQSTGVLSCAQFLPSCFSHKGSWEIISKKWSRNLIYSCYQQSLWLPIRPPENMKSLFNDLTGVVA